MGGTELEVLKAVRKKGGEASISAIASEIRMGTDYTRIVCRGLGMADYVDVFGKGRVRLTEKGMVALRRAAPREKKVEIEASGEESEPEAQGDEEQKPLSPEEKYLLWTSREIALRQADVLGETPGVGEKKEVAT